MKIVRIKYHNNGILGDLQIKCECGHEFEKTDIAINDVFACPGCGFLGTIKILVEE